MSKLPPNRPSKRLYISNLPPSVSEYTIIQLFSKYGKIAKLDWLWSKGNNNPHIGSSTNTKGSETGRIGRGYCFLEFETLQVRLALVTPTQTLTLPQCKIFTINCGFPFPRSQPQLLLAH
jgi:RNA recognition motif-containing protein